ncbi:MAG TPA: DNA recombination protein RmuC [Rhizomicrobium sp.]|nr:DNA recombination protein RmuC [Rhizomicrobium sp.]
MEIALIVLAVAIVAAALILAFARPKAPAAEPAPNPHLADPRLDTLLSRQGETLGQFTATVAAQEALARTLGERLEALEQRMADKLAATAQQTGETFVSITERLAVIDAAQKNISELSTHVVSLKAIFSDKQARGAVSQDQMEAIVAEHLAPGQYEFQATLSNGKRPDCAIRIPNVTARIVVDSKFPLEAFEALRVAETDEQRKAAMVFVRDSMAKHVKDIKEKYLIPGEVQTPAIMFVPSDSIYAELHANFPETLRRARQDQVVVVSPHVFMLVIGTIQSLMRDARMREQAHAIQVAVGSLLQDVRRLGERVGKLRDHFETTSKDIGQIEISMKGIDRHAERIAQVELGDAPAALSPTALPKG